jgi:hypothetical protein
MTKEKQDFYIEVFPMTIVLFFVGTFIYGGMSVYALINRGFHNTPIEYILYGWALLAVSGSWFFTGRTIQALLTKNKEDE